MGPPAARLLLPVAAAVMVGLFTAAVVMNVRLADRTGSVERANSTLTAQVAQSEDQRAVMAETVHQLQTTNYWLANPANQPVALTPPGGAGDSQGMLLVANDGRGAVLLLSGIGDGSPTSTYQVWLMHSGDRVLAGTVEVDDRGWGATTIWPQESLFRFDKVELVTERIPGVRSEDMVLEADIQTLQPSQMLAYPILR